jgi:hypothetical protein
MGWTGRTFFAPFDCECYALWVVMGLPRIVSAESRELSLNLHPILFDEHGYS